MKQDKLVAAIVLGAICFAVGFIGGALLTMPDREETKSIIAAAETRAEKDQTIAQQEIKAAKEEKERLRGEQERVTLELKKAKTETVHLDNKLKLVNAELAQTKTEITQTNAELIQARADLGKAKEEVNTLKTERNKALEELGIKRKEETAMREATISEYDEQVAKMLSTGAIHSIDVENNEVRIDPFLWLQLNLEQKQGLVMYFSQYFDIKGSTGRVTILSNQNDTKLATYGSWGGLKILK